MKMQIAYLPGGKWMLVLSEVSDAVVVDAPSVTADTGACLTFVVSEPVELEGEIAYASMSPPEPERVLSTEEATDLLRRLS